MSALTGLLYCFLLAYLGGWFFDKWSGNFSLLMLILTLVTFLYWLAEKLIFLPRRRRLAQAASNSWELEKNRAAANSTKPPAMRSSAPTSNSPGGSIGPPACSR